MLDETTNAFKMGSELAVRNLNQHHLKEAARKRASFPNHTAEPESGTARAKSSICTWEQVTWPQFPLVLKLLYHPSVLARTLVPHLGPLLDNFFCNIFESGQQVCSYLWSPLCSFKQIVPCILRTVE